MSEYVKKVDILLETEVFELKYAAAKDIIEKVKEVLTKNVGQIQLDEQANSIVATDTPLTIGKIKELIASLDFLNREIRIESKVLQIILNDEHETGVDWEAIVSGFQDMDFAGFTFKTDAKEERKLSIGSVSREDYKILLEALDTVGVVNNVSDEIIKIENENTGMLNVLSELAREIERSGSNADEGDHRDPEEKVQFHLTPVIDRNGMITVSILPDHIDKNTGGSTRTPGSSAAVQIKDGETIVIGSLFEEAMVESMWKIPLLGDLPLLGFVFRNQGEEPRKAEVVTFLTVKTVEKKSKK
jgi:type II secretory pathway component GspD/PulD (secretin)